MRFFFLIQLRVSDIRTLFVKNHSTITSKKGQKFYLFLLLCIDKTVKIKIKSKVIIKYCNHTIKIIK